VPTNEVNYFYNCVVHGDLMRGDILTVAARTARDHNSQSLSRYKYHVGFDRDEHLEREPGV